MTLTSQTAVTLTWQDNSDDELGFRVDRSPDGYSWAQTGVVTSLIGSLVYTDAGYVDTGLAYSTTYYYRVQAYNDAGGSGYSGIARATTLPPEEFNVFLPLVIRNWPPTYSISGQVTNVTGASLAGVTISVDSGHTVTTGADGGYTLSGLLAGSYTLTPIKNDYTFSPTLETVSVPPDAAGVDFVGTSSMQRLVVFEAFMRPGCGSSQAGALVIENQLAPEYAGRPVLFLEHDEDSHPPRRQRWWDGWAIGGTVGLPTVMVDSGNQVAEDFGASSDRYNTYKDMVETALSTPEGQALIEASAQRSGDTVTANVEVTNRGSITLGSSNKATVWLLVYEQSDSGPVTGRFTKRYVHTSVSQAITSNLVPGGSGQYVLTTVALSGVDWDNLHAVVLVDYRPDPSQRPYNTYQAIPVSITQ